MNYTIMIEGDKEEIIKVLDRAKDKFKILHYIFEEDV